MQKKTIVGCVALFFVLCILGYLFYSHRNSPLNNTNSISSDKNDTQVAETGADKSNSSNEEEKGISEIKSIPGWKTYENQKLGYRLQYPGDWVASDEGKVDPAYPYDIELSKTYADSEKGYEYYIGITSSLYGTNAAGVAFNKESMLKDINASGDYKKISVAGGEGYYAVEKTPGGDLAWTVQILGDKGVVVMYCHVNDSSKESLYRQVIETFQFN